MQLGAPVWTTGQFQRVSALDDLGMESVGAGLLRRLIPGLVQTTPNAGYYAFYPYMLTKWEELNESTARADFKGFFRRQEAAYALACVLHDHRGSLYGIQGYNKASDALEESGDEIDVAALASGYMESPYGGYGLFYGRVLEDIRLTKIGAGKFVDLATDLGKQVAVAFGESFENTRYYRDYFDAEVVPREVLRDLGEHTCLCGIPGRSEHKPLLDVFFGEPLEDPVWEDRRQTRVESLALFLEFHRQRPDPVAADRHVFRVALAQGAFPDTTPLATAFPERQRSWQAYQLRECQTLLFTTIWSRYLERLEQVDPITHAALREDLVAAADWAEAQLDPDAPLTATIEAATAQLPTGGSIIDAAQAGASDQRDDVATALAGDLRCLLALSRQAGSDEAGFVELRDEGGPGRWSLAFLDDWLDARRQTPTRQVLADLLDELHYQHIRVALGKVSPTDSRDPFCFSDDDGLLRLIRRDEPFWTGARYEVVNHLLWTLGLLTEPSGEIRLTELGEQTLQEANSRA